VNRSSLRVAVWIAGFTLLAALLLAVRWWITVAADRSLPLAPSTVIIPRGASFDDVAAILRRRGIIGDATAFRLYARLIHADTAVRAGEYEIQAHTTPAAVLKMLTTGTGQVAVWVTIPEGFTAAQIARRLQRDGIGPAGAYERYFMHHSLDVDGWRTRTLEGVLFPDTYLFPAGASPRLVAHVMTAQFLRELPADAAARARALGFTLPQIITIASMIEREAKVDAERPLMASVYYNRLRLGMPLQVDATIEYALPHHADVITRRDLEIDSPYNTYLHRGLPPTPIANPGLPSLLAALHPAKTDYLYYVYKGGGRHAFARTYAEQQANIARYER